MTNDDLLKTYLDKMNQETSEMRRDIRERDARMTSDRQLMEERFDKQFDKMEQKMNDVQQELKNYGRRIQGLVITIVLGIAAMIVAIIFGVPAWLQFLVK